MTKPARIAVVALSFAPLLAIGLAACEEPPLSARDVQLVLTRESAALAAEQPAAAGQAGRSSTPSSAQFNPRLLRRFKPLRSAVDNDDNPATEPKVRLGRMLYFEQRLSRNHDLSCNSCHALDRYGVDGERTSPGHRGQRGNRNSPTVYNAAGHFVQFWDGRAHSIEEQAKGPITNPVEMALADGAAAEAVLRSIPEYVALFRAAFPGEKQPVTYNNIGNAIGAFESKLMTPSRWDKYLRGDASALTAQEVEGLKVFTNVGCMVCHTGEYLGGSMFEKAGVVEDWIDQTDQGRFGVTRQAGDQMMFKVPSLRNIEKTAPYFHDGSAKTLDEAVQIMGKHQLGLELSQRERAAIIAWFHALTGELPSEYIKAPELPPSTATTPAPHPV